MIDYFYKLFEENKEKSAIVFNNQAYSYRELTNSILKYKIELSNNKIAPGEVVAIKGDFSINSVAMIFALIENKNIVVPLVEENQISTKNKMQIAQVKHLFIIDDYMNKFAYDFIGNIKDHFLYENLDSAKKSGLVLFSSGTTGEPKGAVHNFEKLLEKFRTRRKSFSTINFLLFDHWGGLNTMFHTLSNQGCLLTLKDRKPDTICQMIEQYKIELLPTSPTFLNMLLLSGVYRNYNLSSLKIISYGSEPMPEGTLKRINSVFPNVKLQQTYGLIELGVLRAKSKSDDSLWVKIGGDGFETRIKDNMLEIKAESAMLGYLNAPSPFTDDGFFMTGDMVEEEGEYIKILGRKSDLINVGGQKVYPAEIENVILNNDKVYEVLVFPQKNDIVGNIICAKIRVENITDKAIIKEIKQQCTLKLPKYMVPVKIELTNQPLYNHRMKKNRI